MLRRFSSNTRPHIANWIGGKNVEPASNAFMPNINPATTEVINHVPLSNATDVDNAVKAARSSLQCWSETRSSERSATLRQIADLLDARKEDFAYAESIDTGKPLNLARALDISRSAHNFRFFADALDEFAAKKETYVQNSPQRAVHHVMHRPVGVAGLISPWNLPLYLLSWKVLCSPIYFVRCNIF